ncbi:MAG: hypothetical protein K2X81_22330, partial [Candidatus Obscuribacterales bacterium]|nr:hypothetical protein [Candidatus Obscuribacterales bacterium]
GLILPPKLAPVQVVIVPIYKTDDEKALVMQHCQKLAAELKEHVRVHFDDREQHTPGFKFNYWEQKGVPVRLNIGPKDIANSVVEIARRDNGEKMRGVSQNGLAAELVKLLDVVQKAIYDRALKFREDNTRKVKTYDEFKEALANNENCFIEAHWCGCPDVEAAIQAETKATIRAIPFGWKADEGAVCVYSGKPAQHKVIFARAY